MLTGYLLAALCVFLLSLFIARKTKARKAMKVLRRLHIPIGVISILLILVHMVMTFPVWKARQTTVIVTGILTASVIVFMLLTYLFRAKEGRKWKKAHQVGAVMILCLIISHVITYYMDFFSYQSKVASLAVQKMTAAGIADGTYTGECNVGYIYAKVEVEVKEEKISNIKIRKHQNERGAKAEALLPEIVDRQTTAVDAVSGATNSSHVLISATEDALRNAKKK